MTANRLSNQVATDKFIIPNLINAVKPSELKAAYDSVNIMIVVQGFPNMS